MKKLENNNYQKWKKNKEKEKQKELQPWKKPEN